MKLNIFMQIIDRMLKCYTFMQLNRTVSFNEVALQSIYMYKLWREEISIIEKKILTQVSFHNYTQKGKCMHIIAYIVSI